jgi:hypothetical protein
MTASLVARRSAAALLAAALGLAALPGCGSSTPPGDKKDEKKDDAKGDGKGGTPGGTTPTAPSKDAKPDVPPPSKLTPIEKDAEKAAFEFLRALGEGTAKADALSAAFVRVVGRRLLLPSDEAKGYSADAATGWLRTVGENVSFAPTLKQDQAGDVVFIRGSFLGPRLAKNAKTDGGYCLRLLKEGGAWKVDWLSLSSVEGGPVDTGTPTPEGVAQAFALTAFVETVADVNGMPQGDRLPLLAAALTPKLRAEWAPPFDMDKKAGLDHNPGQLHLKAVSIGGGTAAFTATRAGTGTEFKVELTKPAGKQTVTVTLAKGPGPQEWLVSAVSGPTG